MAAQDRDDVRPPGMLAPVESLVSSLLRPVTALAHLPAPIVLIAIAVIGVVPWVLHADVEFKMDDLLLIARGVETGVVEGLVRNFTRPFCDTWTIEFYRPLFTWSFCVEGHLFGGNPRPYYAVNIAWHVATLVAGWLLVRRWLGAEAALGATILFATNPWAANNVAWIVGRCSVVATLAILAGTLAYVRWRRRGATGLPWLAFAVMTAGMFYRETTLFLPVIVFLHDVVEGRRDRRTFGVWCFLSSPFVVYMLAKFAVLGTFIGGYARTAAGRGPVVDGPGLADRLGDLGITVLDVLIPGRGDGVGDWDGLRWVAATAGGLLLALALLTGAWRKKPTWVLLLFAAAHAAPLLSLDMVLNATSSQRWYPIMWALAAAWAGLAGASRVPRLGLLCVLVLAVCSAARLHANLEGYEETSRFAQELRREIAASKEDTVFVYGVRARVGASPFYAVGLGQTQLPPFVEEGKGKAVFPIFDEHRYTKPPSRAMTHYVQTPVAGSIISSGGRCDVLFINPVKRTIERPPWFALSKAAEELRRRLKPIVVASPSAPSMRDVESLTVDLDATGLARLDMYIVCSMTQIHLRRVPTQEYVHATFHSDGRFTEDLTAPLEFASLLSGPANGRCWLWIVGYDSLQEGAIPIACSDFFEMYSTAKQKSPHR